MDNEEDAQLLYDMLSEVARVGYFGNRAKSLLFLLSDIIKWKNVDDAQAIFKKLLDGRHITNENVDLLYDIINITQLIYLENTIKKYRPNCPDLKSWHLTGVLSHYRVMLYRVAENLSSDDIENIKFRCRVKQDSDNVWSIFMWLQTNCKIENNDEKLKKLKSYINPLTGKLIDEYCARPIEEREHHSTPMQSQELDGHDEPDNAIALQNNIEREDVLANNGAGDAGQVQNQQDHDGSLLADAGAGDAGRGVGGHEEGQEEGIGEEQEQGDTGSTDGEAEAVGRGGGQEPGDAGNTEGEAESGVVGGQEQGDTGSTDGEAEGGGGRQEPGDAGNTEGEPESEDIGGGQEQGDVVITGEAELEEGEGRERRAEGADVESEHEQQGDTEDTQSDGAGDADDAQANGTGDAGRVQNQQANTHNEDAQADGAADAGRVQNQKIANGHNGMMWLIGCAIAIISMIATIVLQQVVEFQSLSNEQKVAFTVNSIVIVLVIIFGGLWYLGAIQPYFQPLSIGQKTFGVFATITIVLTINFALYYFPTIQAYFESLSYEEKVSFGLFTFAIVLIISGLFYNFMYFGEFSKGQKVAFVFVTVIVVCIIFYILYHFAAILSELVSLSNEQKAGVIFFVIALVLLMFRVFSITSVPLLKFLYDQVLKLL